MFLAKVNPEMGSIGDKNAATKENVPPCIDGNGSCKQSENFAVDSVIKIYIFYSKSRVER